MVALGLGEAVGQHDGGGEGAHVDDLVTGEHGDGAVVVHEPVQHPVDDEHGQGIGGGPAKAGEDAGVEVLGGDGGAAGDDGERRVLDLGRRGQRERLQCRLVGAGVLAGVWAGVGVCAGERGLGGVGEGHGQLRHHLATVHAEGAQALGGGPHRRGVVVDDLLGHDGPHGRPGMAQRAVAVEGHQLGALVGVVERSRRRTETGAHLASDIEAAEIHAAGTIRTPGRSSHFR